MRSKEGSEATLVSPGFDLWGQRDGNPHLQLFWRLASSFSIKQTEVTEGATLLGWFWFWNFFLYSLNWLFLLFCLIFHAIGKVNGECSVQVHFQVNINLIIKLSLLTCNSKQ